MKRDYRPYFLKQFDIKFQKWYVNHFLRPQFEHLGKRTTFMKPWHVELFGENISLGNFANVIAASDKKVRLTVWSNFGERGCITIGDYCLICPGVRISAATEIIIGDSCMMAQEACITDSDWHGLYDRSQPVGQTAAVRIGNNAWIGDSAMVCKGVTIGDNSIIGAGSIVTKDIPPNVIAAGNPAVVIKKLDKTKHIKTRADWFSDPEYLAKQFREIDRHTLENNTLFGWLRSILFPSKE
ncbi:MAG TPA: acyltransferase [Syntrophales bacterium]|nr:acyltransferase [Syntrophales bacterium]HPQ43546.1 acyltransferase [Syntrophales bacterium]